MELGILVLTSDLKAPVGHSLRWLGYSFTGNLRNRIKSIKCCSMKIEIPIYYMKIAIPYNIDGIVYDRGIRILVHELASQIVEFYI